MAIADCVALNDSFEHPLQQANAAIDPTVGDESGGVRMNERVAHPTSIDGPFDLEPVRIVGGGRCLPLDEFLVYCAHRLRRPDAPLSRLEDLDAVCETFLRAGLRACTTASSAPTWIHVGLAIGEGRWSTDLYRQLAAIARAFLDYPSVSNFFFMHKPPGLRVRFEASGASHHDLEEEVYERLKVMQDDGVVSRIVPGIYEPETQLFGGPVSMRSVHRLFTIDSLAWLDYHSLAAMDGRDPSSKWAISLWMLRGLFTELGITGWEDLDVWSRIRRKTGRCLPLEALSQSEFATVAAELQAGWMQPHSYLEALSPHVQGIARDYYRAITPVVSEWNRDYFETRGASIGPREAAAFFAIFHWNRSNLSLTRQALITEALAARERI
jgi:thiopeptide-type bacteriocin biosynthesis protein